MSTTVSRRHFVGGLAAALGYFGTHGDVTVAGQAPTAGRHGRGRDSRSTSTTPQPSWRTTKTLTARRSRS